jgi:hypothetical protein
MTTTFNCPSCKAKNERRGPEVGCAACGFGRQGEHTHEVQPSPHAPRREEAVPPPPGFQGKYLTETC